jgi:drug/metabolite transporter (DMT)-like permease
VFSLLYNGRFKYSEVFMSLGFRAKFMQFNAIAFIIFGVIWGLAPYVSINLPSRFIIDVLDWPLDNLSAELSRDVKWLTSIGAGLLTAFSIFLYGVVAPAIKHNDKKIIRITVIATIAWFVIDSTGSIVSGVTSNAFFNAIFFVMLMAPLVGIKEDG